MKTYKSTIHKISLVKEKTDIPRVKINASKDAVEYFINLAPETNNLLESFHVLLLNRANNTDGYACLSVGGTASTIVDVKVILKIAIDSLAEGVILIHNHPSGNLVPSKDDISITNKVKVVMDAMGMRLLDHIIVNDDCSNYYSFADDNIL